MERIAGIVVKVLWSRDDDVLALMRYDTSVGMVDGKVGFRSRSVGVGDAFVANGRWKKQRGRADEVFQARSIRASLPSSPEASVEWLLRTFGDAGLGVDAASVNRFVDAHGPVSSLVGVDASVVSSLSAHPARHAASLVTAWGRAMSNHRALALLEEASVSAHAAEAILDRFRDSAHDVLVADPFEVAPLPGVGFEIADDVARVLGIAKDDPRRVEAALRETLRRTEGEGHTWTDVADVEAVMKSLEIPPDVAMRHAALHARDVGSALRIEAVGGRYRVQMNGTRTDEERIAAVVAERVGRPALSTSRADAVLSGERFARLDEVQRAGVRMGAGRALSVLTGGPGTGKSTVLEAVVASCDPSETVLACAPTQMAAKRLTEAAGVPAQTVHALLEAKEDGGGSVWGRNASNPLPDGCTVVVDEVSMLDVPTFAALVDALPQRSRLLLVGDAQQLPSVGAGAVLNDLLTAGGGEAVPHTRLVNVYRTARDSRIATAAKEIAAGVLPAMDNSFAGGVAFFEHVGDDVLARVEWCVVDAMMARRKLTPKDVVVLVPQAPGPYGYHKVNARLSARLNPNGEAIPGLARGPGDDPDMPIPRVGDRVMSQLKDKDLGLSNGETGTIVGYGKVGARPYIEVALDRGETIRFPGHAWRQLGLAYAVTVHKSQGSQFPAVVMVCVDKHAHILDRTLVYTGWTRAKSTVMVVGQREAFEASLHDVKATSRRTSLRAEVERRLGLSVTPEPGSAPVSTSAPAGPPPPAAPPPVRPEASPSVRRPPPRRPATRPTESSVTPVDVPAAPPSVRPEASRPTRRPPRRRTPPVDAATPATPPAPSTPETPPLRSPVSGAPSVAPRRRPVPRRPVPRRPLPVVGSRDRPPPPPSP